MKRHIDDASEVQNANHKTIFLTINQLLIYLIIFYINSSLCLISETKC